MANEWQVESVFTETLVDTTAPLQAEAVYAEVLTSAVTPMQAEIVYAEVLFSTQITGFTGWGQPI